MSEIGSLRQGSGAVDAVEAERRRAQLEAAKAQRASSGQARAPSEGRAGDTVVRTSSPSPLAEVLTPGLADAPASTVFADALAEPSAERRAVLLRGVWSRAVAEGSVELARGALSALVMAAQAAGNDPLRSRTAARLALLEGRFDDALQELSSLARTIDGGSLGGGAEVEAARREVSLELALVHEAAARTSVARGEARGALDHLEAASVHVRSSAPIHEGQPVLTGALLAAEAKVANAEARVVEARAELDGASSPTHRSRPEPREAARARLSAAEQALADAKRERLEVRGRVVKLVSAAGGEGLERPEVRLADVFGAAGDTRAAARFLEAAVAKVSQRPVAEQAAILHALVGARLELGDHVGALRALEAADRQRKELDPSDDAAAFLDVQARFLRSELMIQAAPDETRRQVALRGLREEVDALAGDDLPPAADALRTRMALRLATVLTSEPADAAGPAGRAEGLERMTALAASKDPEIAGEARLQLGLAKIAEGHAVEAVALFARIEAEEPTSAAARAVREMPALARLRDASGKLSSDVSAADVGAAFAVALDAAMKVPDGRTIALMVLGAGAVALTGGAALPALLAGASAGAMLDRGLEVERRLHEVSDAYASGLSRVDARTHATHLLMLGVEALSFGIGGRIAPLAGAVARNGVARAAELGAGLVPRLELGGAGALVGRALVQGAGKVAEHATIYASQVAGRALVTGRFEWDAREALLMSAMLTSFSLAHQLGAGPAAAKALGLGGDAAKLAGFTADTVLASSAHYALLTGIASTDRGASAPERFDRFLAGQLSLFAAWQAGQAMPATALDRLVARLDASTEATLARADAKLPPSGSTGGLRPREAYALGRGAPKIAPRTEPRDLRRPWAVLAESIERPQGAGAPAQGAPKSAAPDAALAEHGLDPASPHFEVRDLGAAKELAKQLGPEAAALFDRRALARVRREVEGLIALKEGRSAEWFATELEGLRAHATEAGFTLRQAFQPTLAPVDVKTLPVHIQEKIAAIRAGATTVRVASRAEAEMILGAFPDFAETPTWPKRLIKDVFASGLKETYHWDTVFGPDDHLIHHRAGDAHGKEPHLQLEVTDEVSVHIFWPRGKR